MTGIEAVCIIISEDQRDMIESYFDMNSCGKTRSSIWDPYITKGKHFQAEVEAIREIGRRITLAVQTEPKGFGHAVLQVLSLMSVSAGRLTASHGITIMALTVVP